MKLTAVTGDDATTARGRTARRLFELLEPICLVTYFADECNEELAALGHRTYWDGYFASRAAPLGRVPAQVVHAAFYSFAEGEAARHIPSAWETVPPETSFAAWQRGSANSVRRILGDELAGSPGLARAADLTTKAATSAPMEGRVMYAGLRTLPVPGDPVTRLWHSANMLREHRGDGHVAALVSALVSPVQSHLLKIAAGEAPEQSLQQGRAWSQDAWTSARTDLIDRGWLAADGALTDEGRRCKQDIEMRTDAAAESPWSVLGPVRTAELRKGKQRRWSTRPSLWVVDGAGRLGWG